VFLEQLQPGPLTHRSRTARRGRKTRSMSRRAAGPVTASVRVWCRLLRGRGHADATHRAEFAGAEPLNGFRGHPVFSTPGVECHLGEVNPAVEHLQHLRPSQRAHETCRHRLAGDVDSQSTAAVLLAAKERGDLRVHLNSDRLPVSRCGPSRTLAEYAGRQGSATGLTPGVRRSSPPRPASSPASNPSPPSRRSPSPAPPPVPSSYVCAEPGRRGRIGGGRRLEAGRSARFWQTNGELGRAPVSANPPRAPSRLNALVRCQLLHDSSGQTTRAAFP
jgi:hypothetical protein